MTSALLEDNCDDIGQVVLDLDEPTAMRRWQRTMRRHLQAIALLDALLALLSDGQ